MFSSHACDLGCCQQVLGKRTELYSCRLLVAAASFSVFLVFTVGSFKPHDLQMHPIIISSARAGALGYDALDSWDSPTSRSSNRVGGLSRLFDARVHPRSQSACLRHTGGELHSGTPIGNVHHCTTGNKHTHTRNTRAHEEEPLRTTLRERLLCINGPQDTSTRILK